MTPAKSVSNRREGKAVITGRRNLESVGEPAFAIDHKQIITEWNTAAEAAFGHRREEVIGRHCYEVLCGEDIHGNAFCRKDCNIHRLVHRAVPVRSFVVAVRYASGQRVPTRMAVLSLRSGRRGAERIIHFAFTPSLTGEGSASERHGDARGPRPRRGSRVAELTRREVEVLQQVALGLTTAGTATAIGISPATVRTHVRNLLRKLGAHTRAEALHLALKEGLLP